METGDREVSPVSGLRTYVRRNTRFGCSLGIADELSTTALGRIVALAPCQED